VVQLPRERQLVDAVAVADLRGAHRIEQLDVEPLGSPDGSDQGVNAASYGFTDRMGDAEYDHLLSDVAMVNGDIGAGDSVSSKTPMDVHQGQPRGPTGFLRRLAGAIRGHLVGGAVIRSMPG
jgi:hypothetical protein